MKSALLLAQACLLVACLALLPAFQERVRLEADFVAKDSRGAYTEFVGRARISGRRSAFSEAFGEPMQSGAPKALREAVTAAISKAPKGSTPADLSAWRAMASAECARAMRSALGGSWTAEVEPGFTLAPSAPPDPDAK